MILKTTRRALLAATCLVSAATLAAGSKAFAQAGAEQPAARSSDIEEVVVTARRREERLQDVPVAVTAMTAERLKEGQVTTARQLTAMVPSLNVNTGNQRDFQRFTLRGQGVTLGAGEGVGVYIADAPVPQAVAGGPGLYFDLENLQVLNGPQGTLFGRNTTGGAVLFTPRRPDKDNGGYLQVGLGNYANREITGALNLAIVPDKLSIRLAGEVRQRDGFTRSLRDGSELDNINYNAYRLGVLYTPTDSIENYLLVAFNRSSTKGTGFVVTDVNPAGLGVSLLGPGLLAELAATPARGVRRTNGDSQHWFYTKNVMAVNTTTINLPSSLTLKNIASFTRSQTSGGFDIDGTPFPLVSYRRFDFSNNPSLQGTSRNDYLTEELQLSANWLDGKLTWVTGGFYQHYYPYGFQAQAVTQFAANSFSSSFEKSVTTAWYAQASLDLGAFVEALDGLKITTGYRYTWDSKSYVAAQWSAATLGCTGQAGRFYPNCDLFYDAKWSAPTWTAGLDYKITPTTLVYATFRTGYKSGGFNSGADPTFPFAVFGPEKVTDYELGLKADFRLGDAPLRTNLAVFKDDYSAIQRNQSFIVPGSNPPRFTNVVGNSGVATIKGFEGQVFLKLFDSLDFDVNYSYLDTKYKNSVPVAFIVKGAPLPYAPKHKVGAFVKYHLPVDPSLGDITVNASGSYQSTYLWGDRDQPGNLLGDYALFNLGANWRNIKGRPIELELFVTNVANKAYKAGSLAYYFSVGASAASYIEPRMYGFRLRYTFGGG